MGIEQFGRDQPSARRLEAVHAIVDVAIEPLGLDELLDALLERLAQTLPADTVTILLREGDQLVVRAARGFEAEAQVRQSVPIGRGIAGRVAATRTPAVIDDLRSAPEVWTRLLLERVRSLVAVPLVHRDKVIGVLHAGTETERDFRADLVLLELVAAWAASAIERARMADERATEAARARLLGDLSHLLSTGLDGLDEALRGAVERITTLLGDGCILYLLSEGGRWLEPIAHDHRDPELLALIRSALGRRVPVDAAATILQTDETMALFELSPAQFSAMLTEEQRAIVGERLSVCSMINVALRSRGEVLGLVSVIRTDARGPRFGESDRMFVEEFAARAAVGIDNARLYRRAHENEQRFRALLDSSRVGFAARDSSGRIVEANRAYAEMIGRRTAAEVIGLPVEDLVPPEEVAIARERFTRIFQGDVSREEHEYDYVRPDGAVVHARVSTSLARDAQGKPLYTLSLVEDVSERYQLEEQLRESQKMDALGRFAGAIAHDFNNVLMAITGSSALMASELQRDHPLQREAQEIREAAERAAGLTRQLLTFSRGQLVTRESLDVREIVENLAPMLRRLLGEDIELVLDLAQAGARVQADRSQIEQVIVNLAANARDAMPLGGRLAIEVSRTDLDAQFTASRLELEPGCYVIIAVSDTGHGIDSETQRQIFEPFFTTKSAGKGTGLDLSTVFGIVSQSGGTVTVYSEPDHGTTFRVYLPATDEPTTTTAPAPGADLTAAATQGATVLVVDDEDAVRRVIERLLERAGYSVLTAADGREAITLAREHPGAIELLITDIVLPGLSGIEVAAEVTQLRGAVKVLYSSGYPGDEITRRGLDPGALFLQKPFAPEALLSSVAQLLNSAG